MKGMIFRDLGLISFEEAYQLQCQTVGEIASGGSGEVVFLLEHPPVFTIGRRGSEANLLRRTGFSGESISITRINRGGDITYHGPGQLVGYPLLDLRHRGRDVHRYLRLLEESLIQTSRRLGVQGYRKDGLTGVWTDNGKLASIGVGVRRWITMHGFALNVCTDLRYFNLINPCGIESCPMTTISRETGREVTVDEVKQEYQTVFAKVLGG